LASRILKRIVLPLRPRFESTQPIFIAGMQRSGTTLLMNVLHLSKYIDVFDEAKSAPVFSEFRIKSLGILKESIEKSRFQFAAYKVICDSHLLRQIIDELPGARVIWAFRDAANNAASQLKKFPHTTRAVRLACQQVPGGGWFAEGLSQQVKEVLQEIDNRDLTDLDYACMSWWARNMLFFEQNLHRNNNVWVINYSELAQEPLKKLGSMFEWIGIPWRDAQARFVHSRSIRKPDLAGLNPEVAKLCDDLFERLANCKK